MIDSHLFPVVKTSKKCLIESASVAYHLPGDLAVSLEKKNGSKQNKIKFHGATFYRTPRCQSGLWSLLVLLLETVKQPLLFTLHAHTHFTLRRTSPHHPTPPREADTTALPHISFCQMTLWSSFRDFWLFPSVLQYFTGEKINAIVAEVEEL